MPGEFDRFKLPSMRAALAIAGVSLLGCNALTGASDLQPVDCIDCPDSSISVDAAIDTRKPAPDTFVVDTTVAEDTEVTDTGAVVATDAAIDTRTPCETELDCDDGNACTTDRCAAFMKVCRNTRIDADGDGESATTLGACGLDCNDNNGSVYSGQSSFFSVAYMTPSGSSSFDYNCDGKTTVEFTDTVRCTLSGTICVLVNPGWVTSVPACGATGKWASGCVKYLSGCIASPQADRAQGCH